MLRKSPCSGAKYNTEIDMRSNLFINIFVLVFLGGLAGCGKVHVTGNVVYSDNGEAVRSGQIIFVGENHVGRGTIKEGKYTVGMLRDGDGIPPGTYEIRADSVAPTVDPTTSDMEGNRLETTREKELYYTKKPQKVEIKKDLSFDLIVERGRRPKR